MNYAKLEQAEMVIAKVEQVRKWQKEYFLTRDASYLRKAKECEKQVDELIDKYNGKPQPQDTNQLNLFQ